MGIFLYTMRRCLDLARRTFVTEADRRMVNENACIPAPSVPSVRRLVFYTNRVGNAGVEETRTILPYFTFFILSPL